MLTSSTRRASKGRFALEGAASHRGFLGLSGVTNQSGDGIWLLEGVCGANWGDHFDDPLLITSHGRTDVSPFNFVLVDLRAIGYSCENGSTLDLQTLDFAWLSREASQRLTVVRDIWGNDRRQDFPTPPGGWQAVRLTGFWAGTEVMGNSYARLRFSGLSAVSGYVAGDSIGLFRPGDGVFYLKNSFEGVNSDLDFEFGVNGDNPVAGDWDGDGADSVGVFRDGVFLLRDSNTAGPPDRVIAFGQPGDVPVIGDWNGDGTDDVGVFRDGMFFLDNPGASPTILIYGLAGDRPLAGDWTGKGYDSVGVYRPSAGRFYLRNSNSTGYADIVVLFGIQDDYPVVGDWNGDGTTTIGVMRSNTFYLKNENATGYADVVMSFGLPGDLPVTGDWDALP
jgi:hypothetical protein